MPGLRLGGLVPLSTVDYPGKLATVLFCQGCPWRCGYCHNPHLLPFSDGAADGWENARAFLQRRRGLLDGVVFSGGEPTFQPGLAACAREAKEMGFAVGLHTGGANPDGLEAALPFVDWVGLDIKARFSAYAGITGSARSGEMAESSLRLILDHEVDHECRTTAHPGLLAYDEIFALARGLAEMGVRRYAVQQFRPQGCADPALGALPRPPPPPGWMERMRGLFEHFAYRAG